MEASKRRRMGRSFASMWACLKYYQEGRQIKLFYRKLRRLKPYGLKLNCCC